MSCVDTNTRLTLSIKNINEITDNSRLNDDKKNVILLLYFVSKSNNELY